MTKPGDLPATKKTLHELAKEFPDKTYRELEKYRDADRVEEAQQIYTQEENKELKENQHKVIKNLPEKNTVILRGHPPDLVEVMAIENDKLKKRAQEAEGELSILKGIGNTSPEMKLLQTEVKALKQQLHTNRDEHQKELDKIKRENNDLYNKIADLTEVAKSKDYFRDPDYQYLINENRKLEEERNELLVDNKKLAAQIEDKIDQLRKSGM